MTKLGAEGGTAALIGLGVAGQVALELAREGLTAETAIQSALDEYVRRALPNATLIEQRSTSGTD